MTAKLVSQASVSNAKWGLTWTLGSVTRAKMWMPAAFIAILTPFVHSAWPAIDLLGLSASNVTYLFHIAFTVLTLSVNSAKMAIISLQEPALSAHPRDAKSVFLMTQLNVWPATPDTTLTLTSANSAPHS